MTRDELHAAAMALPGAVLDIKGGADHCDCVGGKMACATGAAYASLSFKATEIAFEASTGSGRAQPSKHLARAGRLALPHLAAEDAAEVAGRVRAAHAAGLPKRLRAELGV